MLLFSNTLVIIMPSSVQRASAKDLCRVVRKKTGPAAAAARAAEALTSSSGFRGSLEDLLTMGEDDGAEDEVPVAAAAPAAAVAETDPLKFRASGDDLAAASSATAASAHGAAVTSSFYAARMLADASTIGLPTMPGVRLSAAAAAAGGELPAPQLQQPPLPASSSARRQRPPPGQSQPYAPPSALPHGVPSYDCYSHSLLQVSIDSKRHMRSPWHRRFPRTRHTQAT